MTKSDIVRPYLERFPDHGDLTLARKIFNENKLAFKDIENARKIVRYLRGHAGEKDRKAVKNPIMKPITKNTNPYKLPDSDEKERLPYILPKANNRILLLSDLHFPYHSIDAITAALDYGKHIKANTIILNGDVMDFYQMSRFEKDPRKRSIKYEFDTTKQFLRILRQEFPDAGIYWLKGNHDVRYEHWLMAKAPEIFDDPYYSLEERLRLSEEKITLISDKQLVKAGKLFITHGHLMFKGGFAPVNIARGLFLRAKQSTVCGHTHKISEHTETNLSGEITTCWSTGCLSELSPDYFPFANNYAHGFADITVHADGTFTLKNHRIKDGVIL